MILFLKHIAIEGPGTMGEFFEKNGLSSKTIELWDGDQLPGDLSGLKGIVVLGGPMNVYEEDKYPFLRAENLFLKRAIEEDIPLLGICLGSQLIAKASGAKVIKSPVKEIGWSQVVLSEEGRKQPLFIGLDDKILVFQWHEDMFEIPNGGELLATSNGCPNQAFKIGNRAYGLQFHVEVTDEIIESWIREYFRLSDARLHSEGCKMIEEYIRQKEFFNQQANSIYKNFFNIMKAQKARV